MNQDRLIKLLERKIQLLEVQCELFQPLIEALKERTAEADLTDETRMNVEMTEGLLKIAELTLALVNKDIEEAKTG